MLPVGSHYDVFADNTCSLVNRIYIYVDEVDSNLSLLSYGRGASRIVTFTYALLDWETKHKSDRNLCTNKDNNHL